MDVIIKDPENPNMHIILKNSPLAYSSNWKATLFFGIVMFVVLYGGLFLLHWLCS